MKQKFIICVIALFVSMSLSAQTSGTCGANVTWTLTNGVLTISGSGDMTSYASAKRVPWYSSRTSISAVVVSDSVTSIGSYAFSGCTGLTSISINGSVTRIGNFVFQSCSGLTTLILPNSVTSIGERAFDSCTGLTCFTIPNRVMSIGSHAFNGCIGITSVIWNAANYPDSLSNDGKNPFNSICKRITHIEFGDSVQNVPAFICYQMINLSSVTIPNSVTTIGDWAFYGCSGLTAITIPDCVTSIGDYAFSDCTGLTSFSIPNSVTTIGKFAFRNIGLTSITIPNSVTSIGDSAFYCSGLTSVIWNAVNYSNISTESEASFFPLRSNITSFVFGDSVQNIPAYLCANMIYLSSVTIPNSVTNIGKYAFSNCTGLTSVVIPNSVMTIGYNAFDNCSSMSSVSIGESVTTIGSFAFSNCTGLTSVTIPNSVTSVGNHAFENCNTLSSISIGESVTTIGDFAFSNCTGLTSITIPNSVTTIGYNAFENCSTLSSVSISNSVTSIKEHAFQSCSGLISVVIPNSVTSIESQAFYLCSGLTSVTIGDSVTSIGSWAFKGCSSLTSITIPNSVTTIGYNTFDNCSSMSSVSIGESVTTIGNEAFKGCSNLKSITIPRNVTSFGRDVFKDCIGLDSVTWKAVNCQDLHYRGTQNCHVKSFVVGDSVQYIPAYLCKGLKKLKTISIGKSVTSIGNCAFDSCGNSMTVIWNARKYPENMEADVNGPFSMSYTRHRITAFVFGNSIKRIPNNFCYDMNGLRSVTIPNSVTSIGFQAFKSCDSLTTIIIPNSVTTIESLAFSQSGLKSITIGNSVTSISGYAFLSCNIESIVWNAINYPDDSKKPDKYHSQLFWETKSTVTSFTIGDDVQHVPNYLCYLMSNLRSVTIGNNVTSFGRDSVFYGCSSLRSVIWNAKNYPTFYLPYRGLDKTFYHIRSSIESFEFGDSVQHIPAHICEGLNRLRTVTIGKNVASFGIETFRDCSQLKSIMWNSVKYDSIISSPFSDIDTIVTSFTFSDSVPRIPSGICSGMKRLRRVTIHNNITSIGANAFYRSGLTSVTIPNSVTSIGDDAFSNCSSLTSISIGESVTTIGESAFYKCTGLTSITIPNSVTSLGSSAFSYCSGLTSVAIPDSVTSLGNSAFSNCSGLASVSIGESVRTIGNWAFSYCSGLTSISIPNSVTSLGHDVFWDCSGLTSVTIGKNVTSLGHDVFYNCSQLKSIVWNATNHPDFSSEFKPFHKNCPITLFVFGDSVQHIPAYLCYDRDSLTSVTIPNSVTTIGESAFEGCDSLKFITIGDSVKSIGNGAFATCYGLTSVTIPNSVTSIGSHAFSACRALTSVTIGDSVKSIGNGAFASCEGLTSVTIPNSVTSIGERAFDACTGLTSVTIPNSVTSIGDYAFNYCSGLTSITIGDSVTSIGGYAFYKCNNLDSVFILAETPPYLGSSAWNKKAEMKNVQLIVPCGTDSAYKSSRWKNYFTNIISDFPYSVNIVSADTVQGVVSLITMDCDSIHILATPQTGCKFSSWNDGCTEADRIIYLTQDTSFVASFERQQFKVSFLNWNGDTLQSGLIYYDSIPIAPTVPIRPNTTQYTYSFAGWSPQLTAATCDTTYTAVFDSIVNKYMVSFADVDGTLLQVDSLYYGSTPAFRGTSPTKENTAQYSYSFAGWTPQITAVTGDVTYTAVIDSVVNKYVIMFLNEDSTLLQLDTLAYGTLPEYRGTTPIKQATAQYTYTFAGWNNAIVSVTGNATYLATYTFTTNKYVITFLDEDGTQLQQDSVEYGALPVYRGETPTKQSTAEHTYYFGGWTPTVVTVTQNATYTATYTTTSNKYVVIFADVDGTQLQVDSLYYGSTPAFRGTPPTKENTAQYSYSFAGWTPQIAAVTGNITYTAVIDSVVNTYVVMFLNEDSTLLQLDTLEYGSLPEYRGATPTKAATAQYTYTFNSWNNAIVSVTGNATYFATYTFTTNKYVITFLDEDGTQLQQDSVEYGALPVYRGETPTKPSTAEHTYYFGGWAPTVVTVTQNATYTATYTTISNKYVVIFADVDGTQLQIDSLYYGSTPVFRGTPPTKENTAQYSYSFAGWTPQITAVTGNITYTAVIDSVVNTYVVMFLNEDSTLLQLDSLAYGTLPDYRGTTPTKQATAQYTYTFNGWNNAIVSVTGNASYVATYTFITNKYVITFLDEDGTQLQQDSVEYGALPVYRGETPTKPSTAEHTYFFGGWTPTVITVTQNATYTATYTETENKYVVTFQNEDGTILQRDTLNYGVMPVYREANPTKESTVEATYTFAGWTPSITAVVADAVYTATYDSVINTYVIMFLNEDSSLLQIDTLAYGAMPEYRGETPVKPNDGDDFFVFTGWEPEVVSVVGDATYVATFERHGTGIDNVAEKQTPVKVMEDGKMYIIMPNGTKYSAAGRKVE